MLLLSTLSTLLLCGLTTANPFLPFKPTMKPHPLCNIEPCTFPCPSNSTIIPLLHSNNWTCFSSLPALTLLPFPYRCHIIAEEGMMQAAYEQACQWHQVAVEQKAGKGLTAKYRAMRARMSFRLEVQGMRFYFHRKEGWAKKAVEKGLRDVKFTANVSVPKGEKETVLEWLYRGTDCEKCKGWRSGQLDIACEEKN